MRRFIGYRILIGSSPFLQKSLINSGSFAESDLRVKALYPVGLRRFMECRMLIGPFLQRSPVIGGSFVESVPRLKASYGSLSTSLYESDATIQCDATHVHYYHVQLPKKLHAHSCTNRIDYIFTLAHSTALRTRIHTDTKCLRSNHALFPHALNSLLLTARSAHASSSLDYTLIYAHTHEVIAVQHWYHMSLVPGDHDS